MADLVAFLLERISEDEAAAERLAWCPYVESGTEAVHITPARVLAECRAKRAIIGIYQDCVDAYAVNDEYQYQGVEATDLALHALAAVYSDHPDYDPAWTDA